MKTMKIKLGGVEVLIKPVTKRRIRQREIAQALGLSDLREVRKIVHSLRMKGWKVLSGNFGLARTKSTKLGDLMAKALLAMSEEIISAAKGLARKDKDELTDLETAFWNLLPEVEEYEEFFATEFQEISKEELNGYLKK